MNLILTSFVNNIPFFFFSNDFFLYSDVLRVNLFFFNFYKSYILTYFLNKFFLLKNYKFFNIFLNFLLKNNIKNIFFLDNSLNINKQLVLKKNNINFVSLLDLNSVDNFDTSDYHSFSVSNSFLKYFFFFYLVDSILLALKIKNKNFLKTFF